MSRKPVLLVDANSGHPVNVRRREPNDEQKVELLTAENQRLATQLKITQQRLQAKDEEIRQLKELIAKRERNVRVVT